MLAITPIQTNVVSGSADINVVTALSPTVCYVNPATLTIAPGGMQRYTVSCSDNAGNVIACPQMAWSSTIGTIASDPTGTKNSAVFTAGDATGTGTVTASATASDSLFCSGKVAVGSGTQGMPATIAIQPASVNLAVGQGQQFVYEVYDAAGNLLDPTTAIWYVQWTVTPNDPTVPIGKVDDKGMFVATANGDGVLKAEVIGPWMSAQAISTTAKIHVGAATGIYCLLNPADLTTPVNTDTNFAVTCIDPNGICANAGPLGCPVPCPAMDWTATIGSVAPSPDAANQAVFSSGSVAGTGTVSASGFTSPATSVLASSLVSCSTPVTVTGGAIYSMQMQPSSASLYIGDTQAFTANGYDINGNSIGTVDNSNLAWDTTGGIGAVGKTGFFTATTEGTGTVHAMYAAVSVTHVIEASAPVTVSTPAPNPNPTPGPGGNGGGSNSGGGSFSSASTMSYTCAGQPGSISVRILKPGATLLAEIYSVGNNGGTPVFSQTTSSDTTMPFTVPASGDYELRVSVDKNQRSVSFSEPACTPTTANQTKEVSIQVKPAPAPIVPAQPKPVATTVTEVAPPVVQQSGIPAWALLLGAVLLLAAAYFLIFGKKKKAAA